MLKIFLIAFLSSVISYCSAQTNNQKLKIFLDCTQQSFCDFDYVRQEIKMADFVRDRFIADVHIIFNTQFNGNGGEQNQLSFSGQKSFSFRSDTLSYFNNPTMTDDEKRKQLVKYLKLGLIPYITKTYLAEEIQIIYTPKDSTSEQQKSLQQKKDKWNFWQFRFSATGYFYGNQNFKNNLLLGNITSSRETGTGRINISIDINKRKSVYFIPNSPAETIQFREISLTAAYLKKLTEHWGVGADGATGQSLFLNLDNRTNIRSGIEYSFTPYSKFNSERIIVRYLVGPEYSNYGDSTIYFKTQEWQTKQTLEAIATFTKKWGSIKLGTFWSNYFSDFGKNNLSFRGSINWRIFKGFQLGFDGSYSFNRDQINIRKGNASVTDVLTQRIALQSSYDYFIGVNINYTFGSIFNNAVFPAFKGLFY